MMKVLVFIGITFGILSHSFADEIIIKNYDNTNIKINELSNVDWMKQSPKKPK